MPDGGIIGQSGAPRGVPISVRGLRLSRGGALRLDLDHLDLAPVGPSMVMGPNGAGKSLLLRVLHGLIPADQGEVLIDAGGPPPRLAMVFQRPVLLRRSVAANLDYVLRRQGLSRPERATARLHWLDRAGLGDQARQPARSLSGGEAQRLALVRALATRPDILFLDEPTASLDPGATSAIEGLIAEAAQTTKIVMVTHDAGQARRVGGELVLLHKGQLLEQGPAQQVTFHARTRLAQDFFAGKLLI